MKLLQKKAFGRLLVLLVCVSLLLAVPGVGIGVETGSEEPTTVTDGSGDQGQTEPTTGDSGEGDSGEGDEGAQMPAAEQIVKQTLTMTLNSQTVTITDSEGRRTVTMDAIPFVQNNRTLVPLRFICENILDCRVEYIAATKTVELENDHLKAVVDLNRGTTTVTEDGTTETLSMDQPPVIRNDFTYMPLRFFSELFGCSVLYDGMAKTVTVTVYEDEGDGEIIVANPPVAQVTFDETVAGFPISYQETSYDPDGASIIKREWRLTVNGKTTSGSDITALTRDIKAGSYKVYLRVQNSKGNWCAWTPFDLKILPNEAPKISGLKAVKASNQHNTIINSGEPLDFLFEVENEEGEAIVAEEWSYSWSSNGLSHNQQGKPQVLYYLANSYYTVTLRVKDAYGNWGSATARVQPTSRVDAPEAEYKLNHLARGEFFVNLTGYNFNDALSVDAENIRYENIKLLASNNPETVPTTSILAQDSMSGAARLRFHHANNTGSNVKIYALAHNTGKTPITLTVSQRATVGPSTDAIQLGVSVVERYLANSEPTVTKVLQPGEIYQINTSAPVVKQGQGVAGLIDVNADGYVKYSIVCMKESSSYKDYEWLSFAPKNSTHIRGTFDRSTINMSYTLSGTEAEKIVLGREDSFRDYYEVGVDAITQERVVNNGNRGIVHKFTITAESKVGLFFSPRGNTYKGVIMIDGEIVGLSTAGMMKGISEACILDVIEAGETKEIVYIIPSGSDSPILITSIPVKDWGKY